MNRLIVGALAAAALLCVVRPAAAQYVSPATTPKLFTTVDGVSVDGGTRIAVTGVVEGESAPSTWSAAPYGSTDAAAAAQFVDTCHRLALLAMAKPGQYLLEIRSGTLGQYHYCKLVRVTP